MEIDELLIYLYFLISNKIQQILIIIPIYVYLYNSIYT